MSVVPDGWLIPADPQLLEGSDRFVTAGGADAGVSVGDFWTWAFSDLRSNAARGVLAEFIVGIALGVTPTRRKGWDNYDLVTADGTRLEVKASAYLQAWPQAKHSELRFERLAGRSWDENTNTFGSQPEVRADVFVFCVQTCKDHAAYNALDLTQWEFYVVSAEEVRAAGVRSVGIRRVRKWVQPVGFAELLDAVRLVAWSQAEARDPDMESWSLANTREAVEAEPWERS